MSNRIFSKSPFRQGQLVTPFGVGSMSVTKSGVGIIVAGLDYWYPDDNFFQSLDETEFKIFDNRLSRRLGVNHFRLPPDFRENRFHNRDAINIYLTVPALRFPSWHLCTRLSCRHLFRVENNQTDPNYQIICPKCNSWDEKKESKKKLKFKSYVSQVSLVVACEKGHISEFPWNEWVHRNLNPKCSGQNLYLFQSSSTSGLSGMRIRCKECKPNQSRALGNILNKKKQSRNSENINNSQYKEQRVDETVVSRDIVSSNSNEFYTCRGQRPWLDENNQGSQHCGLDMLGCLRSSSNAYYPEVKSAIFLPEVNSHYSSIINTMEKQDSFYHLSNSGIISAINFSTEDLYTKLRSQFPFLKKFNRSDAASAFEKLIEKITGVEENSNNILDMDEETRFRHAEYERFCKELHNDHLYIDFIESAKIPFSQKYYEKLIQSVSQIKRMRETRAFIGFSRILASTGSDLAEKKAMLWKNQPDYFDNWLPGVQVYGEGIFIKFNEEQIIQWEKSDFIKSKITSFINNVARQDRLPVGVNELPRYFMIHTFSHLLINEIAKEAGYNAASIRERIYCSKKEDIPMAGLLIYTSDGDAEGTMGGLVRMAEPHIFSYLIDKMLHKAQWCSMDPVCTELGQSGGQGYGSMNLSCCSHCGLLPETSCENFNSVLDRGSILSPTKKGFFDNEN
jgi:hypothetical protein